MMKKKARHALVPTSGKLESFLNGNEKENLNFFLLFSHAGVSCTANCEIMVVAKKFVMNKKHLSTHTQMQRLIFLPASKEEWLSFYFFVKAYKKNKLLHFSHYDITTLYKIR